MSKYTVGQSAWYEPRGRSAPRTLTVMKVGRKWITLDSHDRFSVEDGRGEGFNGGRIWPSREVAEADAARVALWKALMKAIEYWYPPPEHLRVEDIRGAARLLGVTL